MTSTYDGQVRVTDGGARIQGAGGESGDVGVSGICHRYGDVDVLHDVSIEIEQGELMTLLGPSGSGKSTLLRIIGGLEHPRSGVVRIGGREVTALPPERREVGIVFQNYALFPHMTIAENVAFPLRMRRVDRREARRRAGAILEVVGLAEMGGRRPAELSGGQQQRVAVARALVFEPRVLLLDEPFGALDRRLREQLGLEVRRMQRQLGITTVFVTHDQDEAFTMSTRIAVMGEGRILQIDAPAGIYREPNRLDVARFLGSLNEFPMTVVARDQLTAHLEGPAGFRLEVPPVADLPVGREVRCGIRPEHVRVGASGDVGAAPARILASIFGGDATRAQLSLDDAGPGLLAIIPHRGHTPSDGDAVSVSVEAGRALLFDPETGARIGFEASDPSS
ncbi:MAG: ABC transporter ATP-binding protein [Actinobacteria bacterium]|nr:ABC transporter ATP-binding protein [Actinomycetota bacterium]